jgi:hypothetical protein
VLERRALDASAWRRSRAYSRGADATRVWSGAYVAILGYALVVFFQSRSRHGC